MNRWLATLVLSSAVSLAAVMVALQVQLRVDIANYKNEAIEAQRLVEAMRVELVATRAALDEMRVAAASATTGFEQLQNSMQLAVAESITVYSEATEAMAEVKYAAEYMRTWVWANFPQEGK